MLRVSARGRFELSRVRVTGGRVTGNVWRKYRGNRVLARVSARFELAMRWSCRESTVLSLLRREFPPLACDLSFALVLAVVVCCFNKSVIIINIFLNPFLLEKVS